MVHFEVGRHPQTLPKYIYLKCKCVLTLFDLPKMGEAKDYKTGDLCPLRRTLGHYTWSEPAPLLVVSNTSDS
jgi:hypothetical protein